LPNNSTQSAKLDKDSRKRRYHATSSYLLWNEDFAHNQPGMTILQTPKIVNHCKQGFYKSIPPGEGVSSCANVT
jgi:hypothetical protein